jgi:hypothetical protein
MYPRIVVPPLTEAEQTSSEYLESDPAQKLFTHDVPDGAAEPSVQVDTEVVMGKVLVVVKVIVSIVVAVTVVRLGVIAWTLVVCSKAARRRDETPLRTPFMMDIENKNSKTGSTKRVT